MHIFKFGTVKSMLILVKFEFFNQVFSCPPAQHASKDVALFSRYYNTLEKKLGKGVERKTKTLLEIG